MCAYNIKTKKNGNWLGPVMDLFGILLDLSLENNAFLAALMDLFQKNSSRLIKLIVTAHPNLSWHYGSRNIWGFSFWVDKCDVLNDSKKGCPLLILVHCVLVRFKFY
jgi:hypothetical protein